MPTPSAASIVVPFRDRRDLLALLLDGLAAQVGAGAHEVVLVDDGSTDGARAVAEAHAERARAAGGSWLVLDNVGRGAVAARETGVAAATAAVLAFTDSDCIPEPGWLAAGVAAVEAGADVVVGRTTPTRGREPLERSIWCDHDDGLYQTCNVFYRRVAFDAAGGFDATFGDRSGFRADDKAKGLGMGEDTLLGWRVRRAGTATFCDAAEVHHAVFPFDARDAFSRAAQAGAFPALVREVPELRTAFLRHRAFLGTSRIPLYAAVLAVATRRPLLVLALLVAWAGRSAAALRRRVGGRAALRTLPTTLALDAVTGAALVSGSIRARTPVL